MLESSNTSFDNQRFENSPSGADLSVESIDTSPSYDSLPRSEEVHFMQKSLPKFNAVYEAIQNRGYCLISGFKKLEDVFDALKQYGDARAYHSSNQDSAILAGGKILGAIWNDSGDPGLGINIFAIKNKNTESGESKVYSFVLEPGQVVLWDPSEVRYLPLSPNSEGDRSSSWYCSFTVVVDPQTIDAAKQYLDQFQGPFGLSTKSKGRYGSR